MCKTTLKCLFQFLYGYLNNSMQKQNISVTFCPIPVGIKTFCLPALRWLICPQTCSISSRFKNGTAEQCCRVHITWSDKLTWGQIILMANWSPWGQNHRGTKRLPFDYVCMGAVQFTLSRQLADRPTHRQLAQLLNINDCMNFCRTITHQQLRRLQIIAGAL